VSAAAVAEARDVAHEDFIGAEGVPVGASVEAPRSPTCRRAGLGCPPPLKNASMHRLGRLRQGELVRIRHQPISGPLLLGPMFFQFPSFWHIRVEPS